MAEAFQWFETRGLNLEVFERRWRKIPFIVVPERVSDRHAIKGQEGIYWLLDEVLRAYWFGADAAAICMCRALTEELVEKHYLNQNEISEVMKLSKSSGTPLSALIKSAEDKHPHVKKHNLKAKILVANEVLHQGKLDISSMQKWSRVPSGMWLEFARRDLRSSEVIGLGGEVNRLGDGLCGERLPAVDLAQVDLA